MFRGFGVSSISLIMKNKHNTRYVRKNEADEQGLEREREREILITEHM